MPGLQEFLALAIVIGVVAVVLYRRRRRGAAHGCADCAPAGDEASQEKPVRFYRRARPAGEQAPDDQPH